MIDKIKAAAIQFRITPGEIEKNFSYVATELEKLALQNVRLVVLPEMWGTGFDYKQLDILAEQTGNIVERLSILSKQYNMVIVGSLPEPHNGKVCNTSYLLDSGELKGKYRKIHLFSLMREDRYFDSGNQRVIVETSIGKVGLIICYDLRFPELVRSLALDGADIITVPGEWPRPREDHWRTLLRARAIENQLFVVAANCSGQIGKFDFPGMSMIIDPKGNILAEADDEERTITAEIDFNDIKEWREKIPCFNDRRPDCY
jgi:predicted amidohydrolase